MKRSPVARRYARALFDIAGSTTAAAKLAEQLGRFDKASEECEDLAQILSNPMFLDQRKEIANSVAKHLVLDTLATRALDYLIERDRIRYLSHIVEEMLAQIDGKSGKVRAEVVTAGPIPEDRYKRIKAALEKITQKKIELEKSVDPELVGGVVARVGSVVYDGSVRSQLGRVRSSLGKES